MIASVNGVAAGAGVGLALACDYVIAAESASFVVAFHQCGAFLRYGYFLSPGAHHWPQTRL
jgi:enoyl-CoA hydratase/carnithine racemase